MPASGQRHGQLVGQHQHAQRHQALAQVGQRMPALLGIRRQTEDEQIGVVCPRIGVLQGSGIEIDEIARYMRLSQQVAQTETQQWMWLEQQNGGHGRSLLLGASLRRPGCSHGALIGGAPLMARLHFHTVCITS
jgi:hypothetical protein